MAVKYYPGTDQLRIAPRTRGRSRIFFTSSVVNGLILALLLYIGATAKKVIDEHKYEETVLIIPTAASAAAQDQVHPAAAAPADPQDAGDQARAAEDQDAQAGAETGTETHRRWKPRSTCPIKAAKPAIILAPQPKAALTAAMPAQDNSVKPSTKPVHLGETFGVTPNPNATRPATVAAIGNPYGGMQGPAIAPHGVVGSTGIGNGLKSGPTQAWSAKWPPPVFPARPAQRHRWIRQRQGGFGRYSQRNRRRPDPAGRTPRPLHGSRSSSPNPRCNTPPKPSS